MTPWMIWLALAALFAVIEMTSGTFYLLVLSLGAMAGAAAAGLEWQIALQLGVAAITTGLGWAVLYKYGPRLSRRDAASSPDVNPDIGAAVRLSSLGNAGQHQVNYRGAHWAARVEGGVADLTRDYTIVRVEGAVLILKPKA